MEKEKEETREISFGEALIGVEFYEAPNDMIHNVKMLAADMANHVITEVNPEGAELSPIKADLLRTAVMSIVTAQMACVKAMTFQH